MQLSKIKGQFAPMPLGYSTSNHAIIQIKKQVSSINKRCSRQPLKVNYLQHQQISSKRVTLMPLMEPNNTKKGPNKDGISDGKMPISDTILN